MLMRRMGCLPRRWVFTEIWRNNVWRGGESASGRGSEAEEARRAIDAVERVIAAQGVRTLLDLPCGDYHWMREVRREGVRYIGGDIVAEIIRRNTARHADETTEFRVLDIVTDTLPAADLILVRDCFVHLSRREIARALANIHRAGIPLLLMTHYTGDRPFHDITTGLWRPVNFTLPPFSFPVPSAVYPESSPEAPDKTLALWGMTTM